MILSIAQAVSSALWSRPSSSPFSTAGQERPAAVSPPAGVTALISRSWVGVPQCGTLVSNDSTYPAPGSAKGVRMGYPLLVKSLGEDGPLDRGVATLSGQ